MRASDSFHDVVRAILLAALVVIVVLVATGARAQNAGSVGIQAETITVFTNQNVTGSSGGYWNCGVTSGPCPVFQDIGQGANLLFYCNTNFTGTIDLEWTPVYSPSATFSVITQASWTNDFACHSLPFGSYFPNIRATVTGSTGSVSAWYTAISGPVPFAAPAIGSEGPTSPVQCDQTAVASFASGASGGSALLASPINRTDAMVICGMTVSFNGATSAGSVNLSFMTTNSCGGGTGNVGWQTFTTANTPQYVPVASVPMRNAFIQKNFVCIFNTSGATAEVSISYASVHVP